MKELEARKRLLVAESEVYRQTLRLDARNLHLYGMRMRQKWEQYALLKPVLLAGLPLASALLSSRRKERREPRSFLSNVMAGWRMYQRMQPLIATFIAKYMAQKQDGEPETAEGDQESDTPAAAI